MPNPRPRMNVPLPDVPPVPVIAGRGTEFAPAITPNFESESKGDQVCIFSCAGERCAVPAANIAQMLEVDAVSPLPLAGSHVVGVTIYENAVLPLVSLEASARKASTGKDIAAVLDLEGLRVGLLVDEVLGFRRVERVGENVDVPSPKPELADFIVELRTDGAQLVHLLSVDEIIGRLRPSAPEARR